MTDANGKYRIEGLPRNSELTLNVIPERDQPYFRTEIRLAEPAGLEPTSLDVKLRRGVMIHGTITEKQTGKPIPNARFDYFPLRTNPNALQYLRYQGDSSPAYDQCASDSCLLQTDHLRCLEFRVRELSLRNSTNLITS